MIINLSVYTIIIWKNLNILENISFSFLNDNIPTFLISYNVVEYFGTFSQF